MKKNVINIITLVFLLMTTFAVPTFASENYQTKSESYTWSEWSTTVPPSGADYETKTQYRYRDKSFVTNGYYNYSGYTRSASNLISTTYGSWYLKAQTVSDKESSTYKTIVSNESKTAYYSFAYVCNCKSWFWKNSKGSHKSGTCTTKNLLKIYSSKSLSGAGFTYDSSDGSYKAHKKVGTSYPGNFGTVYLTTYNGNRTSYFTSGVANTWMWKSSSNTAKVYRPVTKKYQYTHWKWGDWSSYSDSYAAASVNREVQTRTLYRYKVYDQTINCDGTINKTYNPNAFNLDASAKTTLSYSSSNTDIATVDSSGYVTMKKAGTVTITITASATSTYKGAKKSVTLNISKVSPDLTYSGSTEINKTYSTKGFSVAATSKTGVTYSSSNKEVLTVSSKGWVTMKKAGTATITIKTPSSDRYSVQTKTVKVTISKVSPKLYYDGDKSISKTYSTKGFSVAATSKAGVTYSSSNKDVLTVSSKGWVTMKKAGKATITIKTPTSNKYIVESQKVNVTITKITQKITCGVGDVISKNYGAKAFNVGAKAKTKLTYVTSNKNIATVSSKGLVTIKNPGTVTITVKAAETTKYKAATKKIKINVALKTPTLTATAIGNSKISLTIGNAVGATGYEIYVKEPNNSEFDLQSKIVKVKSSYKLYEKTLNGWRYIKNIDSRTVKNGNLKIGKTYKYKVKAYKSVNGKNHYSGFSNVKSAVVR